MLQLQAELMLIAEQFIREADDEHISSYYAAERTEFFIDSYVLLDYKSGPPTRLHKHKRGPFKVVRFLVMIMCYLISFCLRNEQ